MKYLDTSMKRHLIGLLTMLACLAPTFPAVYGKDVKGSFITIPDTISVSTMELVDKKLYVGTLGERGPLFYDLRNQNSINSREYPNLSSEPDSSPRYCKINGKYLVVGYTSGHLGVFDISDPMQPRKVSSVPTKEHPLGLSSLHSYIYVSMDDGLEVFKLGDEGNISRIGHIMTDIAPGSWCVGIGNTLFFTTPHVALSVVDCDDPANPKVVYQVSDAPKTDASVIDGNLLLCAGAASIAIFDISNVRRPKLIGTVLRGSSKNRIVTHRGYAYVAEIRDGLGIYDYRNPTKPRLVKELEIKPTSRTTRDRGGGALDVAIDGKSLYVLTMDGIRKFDLADPEAPVPAKIGDFPTK